MTSLKEVLLKHKHRLADTIQINDEVLRVFITKKILSVYDLVHLSNCKALLGNTAAALELIRLLASRDDLLTIGDIREIFYQAGQAAVVKIFGEFQKRQVSRGRIRFSCFGRYCAGRAAVIPTLVKNEDEGQQQQQQQIAPPSFPVPLINTHYYYDSEHVLGTGRTSKVFQGYRDNDPDHKVAVKLVLKNQCTVSEAELNIAKQIWHELGSPSSTNVVPVFDWSVDANAYFIVMELATANLRKAIDTKLKLDVDELNAPEKVLGHCVHGLEWLHDRKIVHNELHPENILIFRYDNEKEMRVVAKIGDFGISHQAKNIPGHDGSRMWTSKVEPWMAPELKGVLENGNECSGTRQMDIYSLGTVYQFCLRDGIAQGKAINPASENLLSWMLSKDPQFRPNLAQVRKHPAFWKMEECLTFLEEVSRSLSNKKCENSLAVRKKINDCYKVYYSNHFGRELDWMPLVEDSHLLERTPNTRNKSYDTNRILSLVELIRDKAEHYQEMRPEVQTALFNNSPYNRKDYVKYFLKTFPEMVINLFCKLASIINSHACLSALKETYFTSYLEMDHRECWNEDENIRTLLNSYFD